jgi:NTE family protein
MTIAFALSGGGSLGAVQVGMLRALAEHAVRADLVVAASVGALNGVYYAARPNLRGVSELEQLWLQVSRHDMLFLRCWPARRFRCSIPTSRSTAGG